MLSDEEKKAIKFVKSELQDEKIARNDYKSLTGLYGNLEIETVLNLIEKQQKEIEELKKYEEGYKLLSYSLDNYISKDKIKAKIEELEKDFKEYENGQEWEIQDEIRGQIDILQSLLEKE